MGPTSLKSQRGPLSSWLSSLGSHVEGLIKTSLPLCFNCEYTFLPFLGLRDHILHPLYGLECFFGPPVYPRHTKSVPMPSSPCSRPPSHPHPSPLPPHPTFLSQLTSLSMKSAAAILLASSVVEAKTYFKDEFSSRECPCFAGGGGHTHPTPASPPRVPPSEPTAPQPLTPPSPPHSPPIYPCF